MICYGCGHTKMRHQSIAAADDVEDIVVGSSRTSRKDGSRRKGPSLAVETEGTGPRSKAAKERADAAVWKGRQVSERLSLPDSDAGRSEPNHAW